MVRRQHGVSLRALGRVVDKSAASVLAKLNGRSPWKLAEAHAITDYFQREHDPSLTMEDLFGLTPLPPLPQPVELGKEPGDPSNQAVEVGSAR